MYWSIIKTGQIRMDRQRCICQMERIRLLLRHRREQSLEIKKLQ